MPALVARGVHGECADVARILCFLFTEGARERVMAAGGCSRSGRPNRPRSCIRSESGRGATRISSARAVLATFSFVCILVEQKKKSQPPNLISARPTPVARKNMGVANPRTRARSLVETARRAVYSGLYAFSRIFPPCPPHRRKFH